MTPTSLAAGIFVAALLLSPTAFAGAASTTGRALTPLVEDSSVVCVRDGEPPRVHILRNCGEQVHVEILDIVIIIDLPGCVEIRHTCVKYRNPL